MIHISTDVQAEYIVSFGIFTLYQNYLFPGGKSGEISIFKYLNETFPIFTDVSNMTTFNVLKIQNLMVFYNCSLLLSLLSLSRSII